MTSSSTPRGILHYSGQGPHLLSAALFTLFLTGYLYLQSTTLFQAWSLLFETFSAWSGYPGTLVMSYHGDLLANVTLSAHMGPSGARSAQWAIAIASGATLTSYLLPPVNVPGRYALRIFAFFLGVPALAQLVLADATPVDLPTYVADVFRTGYWFMLMIPVLLGLTGLVLPGNIAKKMLMVLGTLLYFTVAVPVLALLHVHLLVLLGVAWIPFLSIFFKAFFLSFLLMAFYGLLASLE